MSRSGFKAHAVDADGAVLTSASVTVRDQSGVVISPSALFTAYSGAGTHASNPFTATGGLISFYVEGSQVVTVSAVSGGTSQTWSNVVLNELIEPSDFATSAQGTLADSATQPADLGTAAATDSTDYATSAQGTLADSALQAADVGTAASQNSTAFATSAQGALADSATQPADLGTAAAADLTTSSTDTTSGRALKVGDFGLGVGTFPTNALDLDSLTTPSGFYRLTSSTPNVASKPAGASSFGFVTVTRYDQNNVMQTYAEIGQVSSGQKNFFTRTYNAAIGAWNDWVELWTTGNYQPETSLGVGVARKMKNKSGSAIADQAQVAGSSLKAVYTDSSGVEQENPATIGGTWINVSGMSIGNNEAAEFTKL